MRRVVACSADSAPAAVDVRRAIACALPVALPVAMTATFAASKAVLGGRGGYLAGFGVYWAACAGFSVGLLGRRRVRELFRGARPRAGRPAVIGAVLLLWPPLGAVATRLIPEIGGSSLPMLVTMVGVALANATLEELLWRGVYITFWADDPWLGWLWPAVGFGAWHLAPQVIHPSSMGPAGYAMAATALGLSWGWVAWTTGSLRWVSVSHAFTDGSGLRNARFFIG